MFLIVDGHPIHKAKLIKNFVEAQDGMLKLFYLPPYSPQLNPDEQVWAHVKRQVARQLVQSKDEMKRLALGALRRIQKLPESGEIFLSPTRVPICRYMTFLMQKLVSLDCVVPVLDGGKTLRMLNCLT